MSESILSTEMPDNVEGIFQPAERADIEQTLLRELGGSLQPGEAFTIGGELDAERLVVTLELADPEREQVLVVEAGYEVDAEPSPGRKPFDLVEARAHAVEFLFSWMHDHLRDDRWPRPHGDWKEYTFRAQKVFLRGSVVNERLEAMADEWLAKAEQNLPE